MIIGISKQNVSEASESMQKLTKREREVLQLFSEGYSQKEIAHKLFLSYHTIVSHKGNIQDKLEAKSCFQLGVLAERYNLID